MNTIPAIELGLLLVTAMVLAPAGVFCAECLLALLPRRVQRESGERSPAIVLIPAHDEETGIERTLRTLLPTLAPGDRVLVVADNCSDQTAGVARSCGAEVVERTDPTRRGKGYAIEFGLAFLADARNGRNASIATASAPVIIFLDADCRVTPDTIDQLARAARRTGRPIQGLNLSEAEASGVPAVSSLGFHFKNLVRPTGLARLGMPCHLMGTGMALPWELALRLLPAAKPADQGMGGNLVEDMQLGVDLAIAGFPALFCPTALVTSRLPAGRTAFMSQRTRWEHGHLRTSLTQAPRLLRAFLRRGDVRLLALGLDLTVPPFSMLLLAYAALWLAAMGWGAATGLWTAALLLSGAGATIAIAVLGGWARCCRAAVPLSAMTAIPVYMLRKVPIYLSFVLRRGPRAWIRTEREELGAR